MSKRGSLFSSKKGNLIIQKIIIHLGMLGLVVFVWFLLSTYVNSIKEDTEFQRIFLSKDIAFLINTLHSMPGDIQYNYSNEGSYLSKFRFEFGILNPNEDTSYVRVHQDSLRKSYPYSRPRYLVIPGQVSGPESLYFSKENGILVIGNNE
jgi:hypothetical protein